MLSVIKRSPHSTTQPKAMPEHTTPESNANEPAGRRPSTPPAECSESGADGKSERGEFSPHSTTAASPVRATAARHRIGKRQAAVPADEHQQREQEPAPRRSPGAAALPSVAEQVGPLRQVLATVYRLAASVSRQHADRLLQIITDLVIGSIETDEFQQRVVDVLRLPFRPLVTALLDQQLTPMRKEMAARLHSLRQSDQQTAAGGVAKEVRLLVGIDCATHQDREDPLPVLSYWQVFEPDGAPAETADPEPSHTGTLRKRRASASLTETEHGGLAEPSSKKQHIWRSDSTTNSSLWIPPRVYQQQKQQQQQQPSSLVQPQPVVVVAKSANVSPPFRAQQQQPLQGDEEWANIHTMLNCILSMVEKTRRALGILQQRANESQHHLHHNQQYKRRSSSSSSSSSSSGSGSGVDAAHLISPPHHYHAGHHHQQGAYEASELRRHAGELIAQTLKATEDRVSQVKRKAEEAVHDVRRAAMAELQRALSAERVRAERLAAEARRQGAEEALLAVGRLGAGHQAQAGSKEVCWNCGRRASETCSGCNVARYCSTFCQHKHWELHHKICGRPARISTVSPPSADAQTADRALSPSPSHQQARTSPKPTSPVQASGQAFVH